MRVRQFSPMKTTPEASLRNAAIAAKIKQLRIGAGFTSYENFAVQYDLDRKYYWSIEKGRNISLEYLYKILEIHQLTLEEFFQGIH